MNTIDVVIGLLLLFGLVRGFMKGFFIEIATLLALAGGLYGAIHFSDYATNFISKHLSLDAKYIHIIAISITFIAILTAVIIIGKLLDKIADTMALGLANKIFGAMFGALKVALILSFVILFFNRLINHIPFVKPETLNKSVLYKPVEAFAPYLFPSFISKTDNKDSI